MLSVWLWDCIRQSTLCLSLLSHFTPLCMGGSSTMLCHQRLTHCIIIPAGCESTSTNTPNTYKTCTLLLLSMQSTMGAAMCLQLSVQSVSEQLQAAAALGHPQHQGGSPKLDTAVSFLLKQSQQGRLQGSFLGRLHSLAVVPVAEDMTAVNSVLQELCNLVSMLNRLEGYTCIFQNHRSNENH